jgi:multidrug transporter EmrE-like cation transporter
MNMKANTLGLILLSVTLSALAQVSFKYGMSASAPRTAAATTSSSITLLHALASPGVLGGLALYGFGTLLWLQVLSRTDLSQAYPFVGIGFVLTALLGVSLFGETMTVMRASGTVLVIIGIYLIARS